MTLNNRFGAALRLLRKYRNLTQEDFSDVSSRTYLSTLERGLKSPTLEKIEQLAQVLEIHPASLVALAYAMESQVASEKVAKQITDDLAFVRGLRHRMP